MGDLGDFSKSRSFSEDDSIMEGAMAHGGGDRVACISYIIDHCKHKNHEIDKLYVTKACMWNVYYMTR